MPETVKIILNGQPMEVEKGLTVIQAAKKAGVEIPHYCWHPHLPIAGNCRMCVVEIEKMRGLPVSCGTLVSEGMVVQTESPKVKEARAAVLEFLLVNHPLDCPICDQVGECMLQIYYMKHDLRPSTLRTAKTHFDKRVPIGPRVVLDRERCIACTRCVRFCDEISKTHELTMAHRGDHVMVTTFPGKALDNPYSQNTVDICPVGALTANDFRFQARAYFLKPKPSVCGGCATGCNVVLDVYDSVMIPDKNGKILRVRPRENPEVNGAWMCDFGREINGEVNDGRVLAPALHGAFCSHDEVIRSAAAAIGASRGGEVLGVASLAATCEEIYLLSHFMGEILGGGELFAAPERKDGFEDEFLISKDKHPNRRGAELILGEDAVGLSASALKGKKVVIVLFADLFAEALDAAVAEAFESIPVRIVIASSASKTTAKATHLIPAAAFAEKDGTWLNLQGRVQRLFQAVRPKTAIKNPLAVLSSLGSALGMEMNDVAVSAGEIFACLASEVPALSGLTYELIGDRGVPVATRSGSLRRMPEEAST